MRLIYWIVVGLVAGWLAGKVMKGSGYGALVDIVLGIFGGIVGVGFLECSAFGRDGESLARSSWRLSVR